MGGARQQDMKFKINGCINTNVFGGKFGGNLCMGNLQQQMEEQDLQLSLLLPIASALAPAIGQASLLLSTVDSSRTFRPFLKTSNGKPSFQFPLALHLLLLRALES